jgi:hypothetical protein
MLPALSLYFLEMLSLLSGFKPSICYCSFFHLFIFLLYWDLNLGPTLSATSPALFCEGFLKIGSLKLFAQAGFELRSS